MKTMVVVTIQSELVDVSDAIDCSTGGSYNSNAAKTAPATSAP